MYKILEDITWCGKRFQAGDQYDFPEANRPAQIKALINKGLIEPIEVAKPPKEKPVEKPKSKTESRFTKDKK